MHLSESSLLIAQPWEHMMSRDDGGRDERNASTTIDELAALTRDGFKNVLGSVADVSRQVDHLEQRVDVIEQAVFTSPPPPPTSEGSARTAAARFVRRRMPSLSSRTERAEGEIAELTGRLLAAEAESRAAKEAANKAAEAAETTIAINKQQSRAQGLAMPGSSFLQQMGHFLWSREGAKFMVAMMTALLAGLATIYGVRAQQAAERAPIVAPSPSR